MRSLGCMNYDPETGTRTYDPERNSLLVHGLSSSTYLFVRWIRQNRNNSEHATPEAAKLFVDAFNLVVGPGYSLAPPQTTQGGLFGFGAVTWSVPQEIIARPDGSTFPAGLIGFVLGNEADDWSNTRKRDAEIWKLAGVPYDDRAPSISEVILARAGV